MVFLTSNPRLAKRFSKETQALGFIGLDGHRTRGGLRASLYNAVTQEYVSALIDFM